MMTPRKLQDLDSEIPNLTVEEKDNLDLSKKKVKKDGAETGDDDSHMVEGGGILPSEPQVIELKEQEKPRDEDSIMGELSIEEIDADKNNVRPNPSNREQPVISGSRFQVIAQEEGEETDKANEHTVVTSAGVGKKQQSQNTIGKSPSKTTDQNAKTTSQSSDAARPKPKKPPCNDEEHLRLLQIYEKEQCEKGTLLSGLGITQEAVSCIESIHPPVPNAGCDRVAWYPSLNGEFSIESAYSMLQERLQGNDSDLWRKIWCCRVPERVKFFLWSLCHDVRDCGNVKHYWLNIIPRHWRHEFFSMDLQDWIRSNISENVKEWNSRFALSVWSIWKQRNEFIFNKTRSPVNIKMMTDRYMAGAREASLISSSNNRLNSQPEKELIRWNPLDVNWFKMNVDGSC
ncbi:putative LRR receptor-like serine/threonine-protein kinase [Senna tora]|uniref:Putative LRR receptor-like serine/threonine-protein kinase n=1 Tax=Senna tora TaxID=362788 RepID=A0A834WMU4_9FABA|nr:putative LRR receptor-like serine/threonine-protein kinase [Senna tora]